MTTRFTDEMMRERLAATAEYTLAILRVTDKRGDAGADEIIWEHGRRNMELHADGVLPIVCPVRDGTDMAGVCVFAQTPERVREILEGDPAVQAGLLTYTIHPCRGFPGSTLPEASA